MGGYSLPVRPPISRGSSSSFHRENELTRMTAHGMLFKTRRDSEQAEGELRKGERESSGNSRLSRVGSALNIGEAVASAHYATFAISL